jgi:hypothetical protein
LVQAPQQKGHPLSDQEHAPLSNPFQAPDAGDAGEELLDPALAVPGLLVRVAAVVQGLAGLFVAVSGVQMIALFYLDTWIQLLAVTLIVVGGSTAVLSGFSGQGRDWAAGLSLLLMGGQLLLAIGWCLYALYIGLLSLLAILGAGLTVLAAPLALAAVPGATRASAARRQLYR